MTDLENVLLQQAENTPEQTSEFFRLSIRKLNDLNLPVNPVNYALIYSYISAVSKPLNDELSEILENRGLDVDTAQALFVKYLVHCNSGIIEELRNQLLETMNNVISSVNNLAGHAGRTNEKLNNHLDKLSECSSAGDLKSVVANIMSVTGEILVDNRNLESQLNNSAHSLNHLQDELSLARSAVLKDALTGIFNRQGLDQEMHTLVNDRRFKDKSFCLLMADIDHFKKINDEHGHLVGDRVLKAFADMLVKKTRDTDFVARYGGEEFVILLPHTTINNAFLVAENIRKAVELMRIKHRKNNEENIFNITVSIGVGVHRQGETAEGLLERCDKALYRAKNNGRNRSMIASSN